MSDRLEDLLARGEVGSALILKGDFTEGELHLIRQAYEAGIQASARHLAETREALAELSERQADAKAYSVFGHEGKWLVDEETWVELHAAIDRALAVSPADTTEGTA